MKSWIFFGYPQSHYLLYCKFRVNFLFRKISEKIVLVPNAYLIVVNENDFLPSFIKEVDALKIFVI